jgi:hypothetical protein
VIDQLPLDFDETIARRFAEFHASNPFVYETLVRLARFAKSKGRSRIGIGLLWERLRWELWIATDGDADYKLNNDFRSRYARLIMRQEEDLSDFFETRRLRAA